MLPLIPILFLAYGALYAFALAIPKGFVEMDVRDAISAPLPLKIGIPIAPSVPVARRSIFTTESKRNKFRNTLSLNVEKERTGENVGFYHACKAASPSCSDE